MRSLKNGLIECTVEAWECTEVILFVCVVFIFFFFLEIISFLHLNSGSEHKKTTVGFNEKEKLIIKLFSVLKKNSNSFQIA